MHIYFDWYGDSGKAILLNGDHAFYSLNLDRVHDWSGLAVSDYKLVVDLDSALDTENRWPPLGSLSLGLDGVSLRVASTDAHGFREQSALKLGVECESVEPRLQVSFTRWAFQIGQEDDQQFFWIEAKVEEDA
jgi:hypothetical protein